MNKESTPARRKLAVYTITERDGKTRWLRIGDGYKNRDDSITVYLDALPANNKLHIRNHVAEDLG